MKHLYLLRHAEAEPWNPLGNDFSRSLNAAGKNHAQLVSKWAHNAISPPDTILCSPARRTRQTLSPLLSLWPQLLATTHYEDAMYGASTNMLMTLAEDAFSYSDRLMMVGHNPGIAQILKSLLSLDQTNGVQNMATGTLVVVEFQTGFKRDSHNGRLLQLIDRHYLLNH